MARLHPRDEVDGLPGRADGPTGAAAVHQINGVVLARLGRVVRGRRGGVIVAVQAEAQHLAGPRFDRGHGDLHAAGIVRWNGITRGLHHRGIRFHIQRGDDLQATLLQQLVTLRTSLAEFFGVLDAMHHEITEVCVVAGVLAADVHGLHLQRVLQRRVHGFGVLLLGDVPLLQHQLEHDIALVLAFLLVLLDQRIVLARVLGDSRDGGGLHHVQIGGGHAEVALGCGFHAIQVVAELGDVQIALQNLGLGILLLHLHGDQHLANLTGDGVFGGMVLGDRVVVLDRLHEQHVLDVLLGQRRTTLLGAFDEVGLHERTHHALHVDAGVSPESTVFARHHCLLHGFGNLLQRHDDTVLVVERRDNGGTVSRVHRRLLRQTGHIEVHIFYLERRDHRFGGFIGTDHTRYKQHTGRHATAYGKHDIGQEENKHTLESEGLLFGHGPHSKWGALPTGLTVSSREHIITRTALA